MSLPDYMEEQFHRIFFPKPWDIVIKMDKEFVTGLKQRLTDYYDFSKLPTIHIFPLIGGYSLYMGIDFDFSVLDIEVQSDFSADCFYETMSGIGNCSFTTKVDTKKDWNAFIRRFKKFAKDR